MDNPFSKFWSAAMAGYKAFKQNYLGTDESNSFIEYEARVMRYKILWAMYENTAYQSIHTWAKKYKADYGLYEYVRGCYNPTFRLGEFWKAHLLGGKLDPLAGDGKQTPSALPILTDNEAIRAGVAALWKASNWQIKKDVLSLWTAIMGDGIIKVVDDIERGKVYLSVVHPANIRSLSLDNFGNIKGYIVDERRSDPRKDGDNRTVKYTEMATRDGTSVVYETFLDDKPYAWGADGKTTKWEEPYGFIPMVQAQANNVGLDFGWAEPYPGLEKFRQADDLGSKLNDQIRILVDAPWLMIGIKAQGKGGNTTGQTDVEIQKPEANSQAPQNGREAVKMFWGPVGSDAKPLVAPLDIAATAGYIKDILAELERDYPELKVGLQNASGDISGRALRLNRAPAEDRVLQRRPNMDNALVRAFQMAIAIGGYRGYKGYEGFGLGSYEAGDLEMSIGDRPVFTPDPLDQTDFDTAFYTAAKTAKESGVSLLVYLKRSGWTDDEIGQVKKSDEYKAYLATLEATVRQVEVGYNPADVNSTSADDQNNDQNVDQPAI